MTYTLLQALGASPENRAITDNPNGWTVIVDSIGMPGCVWSVFFTSARTPQASDWVRCKTWGDVSRIIGSLLGPFWQVCDWQPVERGERRANL